MLFGKEGSSLAFFAPIAYAYGISLVFTLRIILLFLPTEFLYWWVLVGCSICVYRYLVFLYHRSDKEKACEGAVLTCIENDSRFLHSYRYRYRYCYRYHEWIDVDVVHCSALALQSTAPLDDLRGVPTEARLGATVVRVQALVVCVRDHLDRRAATAPVGDAAIVQVPRIRTACLRKLVLRPHRRAGAGQGDEQKYRPGKGYKHHERDEGRALARQGRNIQNVDNRGDGQDHGADICLLDAHYARWRLAAGKGESQSMHHLGSQHQITEGSHETEEAAISCAAAAAIA